MFSIKKMNWIDWSAFLTPIVTGYITSYACGMDSSAGETVSARPPSWVFGVMWPILYLLLGSAWVLMRNHRKSLDLIDGLFLLNVLCLIIWLIVYSGIDDRKNALYVLLVSFGVALVTFLYTFKENTLAGFLLGPYVAWLLFAMMLNFEEVNQLY